MTVEFVTTMTLRQVIKCIESVLKLYNGRGFRIAHMLGDEQFEPLKTKLKDEYDITFNEATANEHVAEIESMI